MGNGASDAHIFALERPDPALWTLYFFRSFLTGPFVVVMLPRLFFRYRTLRYRFDDEGIHMRVGILFRKEVNLTYARIQDIHLNAGLIQRYLGLADIQIQTASGAANAELVIEGFKEFEAIRDFLYARMRGARSEQGPRRRGAQTAPSAAGLPEDAEMLATLQQIRDELRRTRETLETRRASAAPPDSPAS